MKWLVGVDLRPGSEGPSRFARWLATTSASEPAAFTFVHVLEEEHLRFALLVHHLDEVTADARSSAERLLERTGASGEIRIAQGVTADDALLDARKAEGADAVIVGRAAGREGHHVVRLGRVARHLLHAAAAPIAVVPPDLRGEDLGGGPVVALSSLSPDSVEACRFAARLAAALRRPLAVVHVARAEAPSYAREGAWDAALEAHRTEAQGKLEAWLGANGVRADRAAALLGSPVDRALDFADAEKAAILVAGARSLSATGRIVHGSTGAALAGAARIPVVIVPER